MCCACFWQEKQVAQLRERSKPPGHAASSGNEPDGADPAQQGAYQHTHAPEQRNGSDANHGDTQGASDQQQGKNDPHGIHHYSQQRPAEVKCCLFAA